MSKIDGAARVLKGLCSNCGSHSRPVLEGKITCAICYNKHKGQYKGLYQERKRLGICTGCGGVPVPGLGNCSECLRKAREYGNRNKQARIDNGRRVRAKARALGIDHYGGKCACCGEIEDQFLQLDHINRDGASHRRELKTVNIYPWVIHNNFPTTLRILCANCNWATRFGGQCPHVPNSVQPAL